MTDMTPEQARAKRDATLAAAVAAYTAARSALDATYAIEHPDCPWDGRSIFGADR